MVVKNQTFLKLDLEGKNISEKALGNYMREMGSRARYTKHYICTTRDSDFSGKFRNILDEQFNQENPNEI